MSALSPGPKAPLNTSVYGQVINQIITDIQNLNIEGIKDRVFFLKVPWHTSLEKSLPCATVTYAPETQDVTEGPADCSVVHYRVLITMIWAANRNLVDNAGRQMKARQDVRQKYAKTRPTGWPELTSATLRQSSIVSGEPYLRDAGLLNLDAQFLIADISVSETIV